MEKLTADAWQIPYAIRVDSVTNFQHSWADGDDLTVEDLVRDAANQTEAALVEKRAIALLEPLLNGNLISPDADTTGVNVTLQYPEESIDEVPEAAAFARGLAADVEAEYPGVRVAISGVSMLNNAFAESGMQDAMTLIPFMYIVLVGMTFLTLRSIAATVATLFVIGFSTATSLGLGAYAGIQLAPISATAPTVILTLAIADSIHILITTLGLMREGKDKFTALREGMRINFQAVAITSVTTIVGFLSLNFSDAPPFQHLGNLTAIGIAAAFFYSIFFLPAFLAVVPVRVKSLRKQNSGATWTARALDGLAEFVVRRSRPVLQSRALAR